MRIISKMDEIGGYCGINRTKAKELMLKGVIPASINSTTNRHFFYTTDKLIDFSFERIKEEKSIEFDNMRDAFLCDDLTNEVFRNQSNDCSVYVVTNQKGGVAKTTISINLAATLAFLNQRVLIIDMDSQAQSSRYLRKEQYRNRSIANIFKKLISDEEINKDIIKEFVVTQEVVNEKTIDILPSELKLSKILELCRSESMPHLMLRNIIDKIKEDYDFVIIDTPPYSGTSLEMSLFASDNIILASDCDEFSKEGIEITLEGIRSLNQNTEKKIRVDSCFISKYNKSVNVNVEIVDEIMDMLVEEDDFDEEKFYIVPHSSVIPESQYEALPLVGFFNKENYNKVTKTINSVSKINMSFLANQYFFDYAIKMINDLEEK